MKYLLIILLVLVVFWIWRSGRPSQKKAVPPGRAHSAARLATSVGPNSRAVCQIVKVEEISG